MKLRIKGNSIRLRLSKSEVEMFSHTGYLQEHTSFGSSKFVYALQRKKTDCNELSAVFENGKITVYIPEAFTQDWSVNDIIGFDAQMELGDGEQLHLLVEKDFKCLEEIKEDQSDNYDNPKKSC